MTAAVVSVGAVLLATLLTGFALLLRLSAGIRSDVETLKGQATIGRLAAEVEARRIGLLAEHERSPIEQRHMDIEALRDAPSPEDQV